MDSHRGPRSAGLTDLELVNAGRERSRMPLRPNERWVAVVSALGVVGAALVIWIAAPPPRPSPLVAIALVVAYAVCSRVRFEVGAGSAAPTQLAFAPMMVLLAPALL